MRIFVSSQNYPIGYTPPAFPSVYWPLGPLREKYDQLFLYYSTDIWKFTVYWSMICFATVYTLVGVCACFNIVFKGLRLRRITNGKRSFGRKAVTVAALYILSGLSQGFIVGAIVGLMLQAIYRAGSLSMSTWIPFCWGFALVLYHICSSYSFSLMIMWPSQVLSSQVLDSWLETWTQRSFYLWTWKDFEFESRNVLGNEIGAWT